MIQIGTVPGRFSFSSMDKWLRCEKAWELSYLHDIPRTVGWASVGGSAVHLASEWYDLSKHGNGKDSPDVP